MPFKSSLTRSAGKLFGVFRERDLSLRGYNQSTRKFTAPISATGGNQSGPGGAGTALEPGNGYKYHIFTSPGNFVIASGGGAVEYVLVGGGGGGGNNTGGNLGAGGGGAGGYLEGTSSPLSVSTYPVVIGPGGPSDNTVGVDSTALGLTAYGGGKGVTHGPGTPGGSGGGSFYSGSGGYGLNPSTPSPIITSDFPGESHPYAVTQGYPGGPGAPSPGSTCPGSGGGGAGAAGQESYPGGGDGSNGGVGRAAFSGDTGIPPSYGTPGPSAGRWFAGGGGGGVPPAAPSSSANGGAGGGGGGSGTNGASVAGTTNTGGGGGAGAYAAPTNDGSGGGSGIVIIRYS